MLHWRTAPTSTATEDYHGGRRPFAHQNSSLLSPRKFAPTFGYLVTCMRHSTFSAGGPVQSPIQSKADNLTRAWWSRSENPFATQRQSRQPGHLAPVTSV